MNKKIYEVVAVIALPMMLQACAAFEAMDSVTEMKTSTEEMNQKMDGTNASIEETNKKMSKTIDAMHMQILALAKNDMYADVVRDTIKLGTVGPSPLMAGGKAFAEEATAEELVEFNATTLKAINTPGPAVDDDLKWLHFNVLQVVNGLAPQSTIDEMVSSQIAKGGTYAKTAYAALMMRHVFINSFMLQEYLMKDPMTTPGVFEESLKYLKEVKAIEKLAHQDKIRVKLIGFSVQDYNINMGLADTEHPDVKETYKVLKTKLEQDLPPEYSQATDRSTVSRLNTIRNQIDNGIAGN